MDRPFPTDPLRHQPDHGLRLHRGLHESAGPKPIRGFAEGMGCLHMVRGFGLRLPWAIHWTQSAGTPVNPDDRLLTISQPCKELL